MFKTRLLSGILLVLIALATIIPGGFVLAAVLCLISLKGMHELYQIAKVQNKLPGIVGMLAAVVYYCLLIFGSGMEDWFAMTAIGFLIILMAVYVFTFPEYKAEQIMVVYFGLFYVTVMLSYVYRTRMLAQGAFLVWLVFLCSWGSDTCAYCVGMLIGKHKMAPVLSPKKSIEGGIGGVVGAALLGAVYALAVNRFASGVDANVLHYAIICGVGSMISQVGDLAASAIKRNHNIKDYGHLIPGHGGILDRFDSVIFTAPIIYYLSVFLIG